MPDVGVGAGAGFPPPGLGVKSLSVLYCINRP